MISLFLLLLLRQINDDDDDDDDDDEKVSRLNVKAKADYFGQAIRTVPAPLAALADALSAGWEGKIA